MSRPARRTVSAPTSTITRTQRIAIITLGIVLALSGVALSTSAALREKLGISTRSKTAPVQQSSLSPAARKTAGRTKADLLRFMGVSNAPGRAVSPSAPAATTVSATKTDSLAIDNDSDLQADPGDTIKYTVGINATGGDATGVTFTDTVDPNTAFVPGSLRATPVAVDDNYAATGNIRITGAAPGVLGNDFVGVPSATITGVPATSANGGDVTVNADGSFTYNPPAGFEGVDTFTYTLTNSEGSNSATVTINVSGMIWFINNTASCPCDGRLTNPFNTLASFAAVNNGAGNNPATNDNIFLYESATDYVGPVTLLNGQRFIGQDASVSLTSITGLTPPVGSDPLPSTNSANATIVNITSASIGITVASGNTLIGFTGGNAVTDITGTGFGTLTISDVTLNGNGQALNLSNGTLAANIISISSTNSATTGVTLATVGGNLTSGSTAVTNPTGIGISVGTSSASLSFGNTSSNSSGGAGVSLLSNTGAITFGSLSIAPDANQVGLIATDNTNTITATSGAITATGNGAVRITRAAGTTPLNITLTSVSSSGGAGNGIILSNTSGSFTVVGTGTVASGGTIANKTGANGSTTQGTGIFLNNATNVSFDRMQLNGFTNFGIRGTTVTGFTLANTIINGTNGNNSAGGAEEGAVRFDGLFGSASITDSTIGGVGGTDSSFSDNLRVINNSGSLNRLTISNTSFGKIGSTGNNSLTFVANNNGTVMNLTVQDSVFTNAIGSLASISANQNSLMDVVSRRNKFSNDNPNQASGGGGLVLQSGTGASTVTYDISCNTFRDAIGIGLLVSKGLGAGTFTGSIINNTVGVSGVTDSGSKQASGIKVKASGSGTHTSLVRNNAVVQTNEQGILIQNNDGSSVLNVSLFGNTVTEPGAFQFAGLNVDVGALGTDTSTVNIVVGSFATAADKNDFSTGDPFDFSDVNFSSFPATTINLSRNGSAGATAVAVIDDDNLNPATTETFASGTVTLVNTLPATPPAVASCTLPAAASFAPDTGAMASDGAQFSEDPEVQGNNTDILFAARGQNAEDNSVATLSQAELMAMVPAAIERWRDSGISIEDLGRLQAMTFEIADLPEGQLASVNGNTVKIDVTAAGYGWYSDISPTEDSEFGVPVFDREMQVTESSSAFGRVDLLTVVARELGVAYTKGSNDLSRQLRSLMQNTLSPGVRRIPDSRKIKATSRTGAPAKNQGVVLQAKGSVLQPATPVAAASNSKAESARRASKTSAPGSRLMNHATRSRTTPASPNSMLADVMLNIGTLPAGESVTITFNVTVDDPFTGALPQVSNQGTVSGTNFSNVLTDDPTVGGAADPTVTPIDLPDISVAVSPASVQEDGVTNLVYTFTRNGSTASPLTVNFSVGGSASFTEPDYTQSGAATFTATSGTVVIPAGSSTATVTVDPSVDLTVEPDETVALAVTSGVGYDIGSPSGATGTIVNDDTTVSVAVSPGSVTEDGATNLVYTFTRVGVTSVPLSVNFNIGGTATFGVSPNDYTQTGAILFSPPAGVVSFTAGSSTAIVTIDPEADSTVEPDETVDLTVVAGIGYTVGAPASASGTITNDDTDVSVAVSPGSVAEDGATNLVYTFTRAGVTTNSLTVNFSIGGTANFGVSPNDYTQTGATSFTPPTGTVTFGAGSSTATVTIDPEADSTVEPDETVDLTVTAGAGYNVSSPNSASGTITNDDTDVTVAVSPGSVAEDGATNLVYTFTRTGVTAGSLTVNFSVGGTATFGPSPDDYTQTGATSFTTSSGSVTFGAGNSTATVTVNPETDSTVEPDETVDISLTSGAGYNVGAPSSASGTIVNDDTDVSVAVSPAAVAEDGATNLVYTFTRNGVTSGALTVNFSVGGTASFGVSPNDYTQTGATSFTPPTGTVTFGAGNSTATVTVNPETDTAIEPDETVSLTLTAGAGYNVSSPSSATGTITNDDADVSVAVAPAAVAEDGATNLVYTFTRTGFTGGALTVNFTVGGTATFGPTPDDYTQTGATTFTTTTGSVTFAPGSPTAAVTVDPETDLTAEADETVDITLTAGASYNVVSPSSATGTILNDDTLVSVVVSPSSTAEGGANLVYTFTRTGPTTSALSVNFSVGGSASFPADYSQSGATTFTPPTATVTFGVGSSTATVTVTPLNDCEVEGSETVEFTVQPGAGYGVGSPNMATGTITNTPDSGAPTITLIPNVNMTLWPPDHDYRSVAVTDFVASASDDCDPTVNLNSVYILKISSDEAEDGDADGTTLNDIVIGATCKTAQLRAERSGSADGRVYTITFKVKDSAGNFTTATVKVTVPQTLGNPAVDSGPVYIVNSTCP